MKLKLGWLGCAILVEDCAALHVNSWRLPLGEDAQEQLPVLPSHGCSRCYLDGKARRIKRIGGEIHLVAVVVAVAVSVRVRRIGSHGGFVGIREAVGIAVEARRLRGGALQGGGGLLRARGDTGGVERIGAGRRLLAVRNPIPVRSPD